jgi:uncharacterized protein (TIGR00255 family)
MMMSMTGFASVVREDAAAAVTVTLRAVNHRYLDLQIRVPPSLAALEPGVRAALQKRLSRGRVDVFVGVQHKTPPAVDVTLNLPLVEGLAAALAAARERGLVEGALRPGDLLRLPQAVVLREAAEPQGTQLPATTAALVEAAVEAAADELNQMRRREGEMLRRDLDARRDGLDTALGAVAAAAETGRLATEARLAQRVRDLAVEAPVEPTLIAQEIVRFVSRSDISEEIVRFRAHLEHWTRLSEGAEPCGRKLDFLLQELNREINTIGSKAEGPAVTELVVHVKAELERMREQIQNVE